MFDRIDEGRWWDFGWQLVEGCTKCSPGCENCWSLAKEARFRKETGVVFHPERLERPPKRKKPTSYSIWNDLFHPDVPFEWILKVLAVIHLCPQHTFQILTKRPERMLELINVPFQHVKVVTAIKNQLRNMGQFVSSDTMTIDWPLPNLWLGVTAENQEQWDIRVGILKQIPAAVRFASVEPMLGPIDPYFGDNMEADEDSGVGCAPCDNGGQRHQHYINESCGRGIDWVIIGAESGPKRRWLDTMIVKPLVNQCKEAGVPVFVKQLHSVHANNPTLIKAPAGWPREMPEGVAK